MENPLAATFSPFTKPHNNLGEESEELKVNPKSFKLISSVIEV
jgi:hypothetical protein